MSPSVYSENVQSGLNYDDARVGRYTSVFRRLHDGAVGHRGRCRLRLFNSGAVNSVLYHFNVACNHRAFDQSVVVDNADQYFEFTLHDRASVHVITVIFDIYARYRYRA